LEGKLEMRMRLRDKQDIGGAAPGRNGALTLSSTAEMRSTFGSI
jgi:hypothetical protein